MLSTRSLKCAVVGVAAVFGLFSSGAFAQTAMKSTPRSAVANPSAYMPIPVSKPYLCRDDVSACGREILYALPEKYAPAGELDRMSQDEVFHFKNGVAVYLLTISGIEDDSIRAERYRVSFRPGETGMHLVQIGRQNQCARGANRGWSKRLCP